MKKKYISIITAALISTIGAAQSINEALNFGQSDVLGTARFTAMSGAFGALGGDLSALQVNPAGSSIFLHNTAGFTFGYQHLKNNSSFAGENGAAKENEFHIPQAGAVYVFENYNPQATVNKFSFGLTYDQQKNLEQNFLARGTSNESIGSYFTNLANGIPLDLFTTRPGESLDDLYRFLGETNFNNLGVTNSELQTAYLGYETYLFDPADPNDLENTQYISNTTTNNTYHSYSQQGTGFNGKFSLNGSLALQNKFYIGLNLNAHFINFERITSYFERPNQSSRLSSIYFENNLSTIGSGFSFQLGGIAKINKFLRLGLSYDSPTWYTISDETTQYLSTSSQEFGNATANPFIVNVFPNYKLRTPGQIKASAALIFAPSTLVSLDYGYKNYGNIKLRSRENQNFELQNKGLSNRLTAASSIRMGAEHRLKNWSLRAGARFEQSPFESKDLQDDLYGFSAGLGYNFGRIKIDFAYSYYQVNMQQDLLKTGLSNTVQLERNDSNYIMSFIFDM
ncbi:OmpP1/FadL family transporter [uncultured Mesonia sp.]|uniref:OmpP1/FadL family transporter n=1 Tax=uncultured Mesonia sp. TaxID=399731 RepID=UPI00374EE3C8